MKHNFGSTRSLHGLYKCYCLSKNIAEFGMHRWLPQFEQELDSQIWKSLGSTVKRNFWPLVISDLLLFVSYCASQNKEMKFGWLVTFLMCVV